MGLEDVLASIRDRGQRKAEEIIDEAEQEAERLLEEAREEADAKRDEARERAEADVDPLRRRELLGAEIEAKKLRLDAQRQAMESVRTRARELLEELPDKERAALLEALVARVHDELASPRIYAATRDADLVEAAAGDAFAGTRDIWGGVVGESKDGTVLVDHSFETLLDEVWQDSSHDVAERLGVQSAGADGT